MIKESCFGRFVVRGRVLLPRIGGILSALLLLVGAEKSFSEPLSSRLSQCLEQGSVVVADEQGIVFRQGDNQPLVPASTLKLATALAAIHYLGEGFRPKTEFYLSPDLDLIVRGYGDPYLTSEEWKLVASRLSHDARLPGELRHLRLDAGAFSSDLEIPGLTPLSDPYLAHSGALAANFNTIHIGVKPDGKILSAEPQTPLTAVSRRLAAGLPPGSHRVNMSNDPEAALRYAGELLQAFLEPEGHVFRGDIRPGKVSQGDRLIYVHRNTRCLREIIQAMMQYSSNFTANQLLLMIGLEQKGEPATLEKGLELLRAYLTGELGIAPEDFQIVEGSGISRRNRLRPEALLALTRAFYPYRFLLPSHNGARVKTGTLTGVYTMAGYLDAGRPLFFAIMLEQKRNNRDRILSLLQKSVPVLERAGER